MDKFLEKFAILPLFAFTQFRYLPLLDLAPELAFLLSLLLTSHGRNLLEVNEQGKLCNWMRTKSDQLINMLTALPGICVAGLVGDLRAVVGSECETCALAGWLHFSPLYELLLLYSGCILS